MHKYLLVALLLVGCSHMPWAKDPQPEPEPTAEEKVVDCLELMEKGATQAEFMACIQQQGQNK